MIEAKRLVNRSAVRSAFHERGARVPRGFMEDLDVAVMVILRRMEAGDLAPEIEISGVTHDNGIVKPETLKRIEEARQKLAAVSYLKESVLKEALRETLGQKRIEAAWVLCANAVIATKVGDAVGRSSARVPQASVPSSVLRAFLRSKESKTMTIDAFMRKCKDPGYLARWTANE